MLQAEYRRLRRAGWSARAALRAARIRERFEDAESAGLVRFTVQPDECCEVLDFDGTEREHADALERANSDGCWGIVSEERCPFCGHWFAVDSVWGFIGDDWQDSGYDDDVRESALVELGAHVRQGCHCH